MIKEIKDNIWQLSFHLFGSTIFILKLSKKTILIDVSSKLTLPELVKDLAELKLDPADVDIIILTHKHFDHDGNLSLFKKAKIYGHKDDFKSSEVLDINELKIPEFQIIHTPGHSRGSICILMSKEKILFSGDTIFHNGYIGRTDLPGSSPEDMKKSLEILKKLDYETLCPGHTY